MNEKTIPADVFPAKIEPKGNYAVAIGLLEADLKANPERSFYRLALGNVAVRAQRFDLAATEYRKLLQSNPNPDFGGLGLSPYGAGYVIWNEDHTSYRVARAEDKVRLLKGEVTADELRGS